MPTLEDYVSRVHVNVDQFGAALHQRSSEVLSTCYELGNLLPSNVVSEQAVDEVYHVDHLISKGDSKVAIEFEGPYHYIKDQWNWLY